MSTGFICDTYFPYFKNDDVRYIFTYHGIQYAIKEVVLKNGIPQVTCHVDDEPKFYIYASYEDALNFVRKLKRAGG